MMNSYVDNFGGAPSQFVSNYDAIYGSQDIPEQALKVFNKALIANEVKNIETDTFGFGATQLHSMDAVMKNLTFTDRRLTFWRIIQKSTAQQLIEQYAAIIGYGNGDGFTTQGGLPLDADVQYLHGNEPVKFVRHVWRVNDVIGFVGSMTNGLRNQKEAAAKRVLRDVNRKLYSGDKDINPLEFDGIFAAIKKRGITASVYDAQGATFTKDVLDQLAQTIEEQWGNPSGATILCSPGGKTLLSQIYTGDPTHTVQRGLMNQSNTGEVLPGFEFNAISTMFGQSFLEVDNFIATEYERAGVPVVRDMTVTNAMVFVEGSESNAAPAIIPVANITLTNQVTLPTGVVSNFKSTHPVRASGVAYDYRISAKSNDGGRNKASDIKTMGGTVTAGYVVQIDIAAPTVGVKPDSYEIFSRVTPGGTGPFYRIGRVAAKADGSATFYDDNQTIPGTSMIFMITQGNGEEITMSYKQLSPMYNKSLAENGMFSWGVINLMGMPIWYAPQKFAVIKNVPVGSSVTPRYLF